MELDAEVIKREKDEIIARYGKWTAHNIHLAGDAYTIHDGLHCIGFGGLCVRWSQN